MNPTLRFVTSDPIDWYQVSIKDLVYPIRSGKSKKNDNGDYVLYGATGIIGHTNDVYNDDSLILAARVGSVGNVSLRHGKFGVSDNVLVIKPKENSNISFIYHLLVTKVNWKSLSNGTSQSVVSAKKVEAYKVYVSSLKEQQKIAAFFTALDEKLVITNKKLSSLKLRKQLLLNRTFKQELNFTDNNYATLEETKLGTIAKISSASRVHRNQWQSDGIPFFRSSDVVSAYNEKANSMGKAYISEKLYAELTKKSGSLQYGDLLITGGGSVGIPYLVKEDKLYTKDADLIWIQRPNNDAKFLPEFLYRYFETSVFKNYLKSISHSGTIAHYTIKQVKDTPIKLPSIEEQKRIVSFFNAIDDQIHILSSKAGILAKLKRTFMQQMFV